MFKGCLGGNTGYWGFLGVLGGVCGYRGVFRVYFASETAQVELKRGRV